MGTRALVRLDLKDLNLGANSYRYFTHNDGNPPVLGAALIEAVQKGKGKRSSYEEAPVDKSYFPKYVKEACQNRKVDSEITGSKSHVRSELEDIFGGDDWHDIEWEYRIVRKGDQIRVQHRTTSSDLLAQEGGWQDTAEALGMTYEPYSFYFMYNDEDGNWKVQKDGNKKASVSEPSAQKAWERGMSLVDNNVPGRIYVKDSNQNREKTYEVSQRYDADKYRE